MKHVPVDAISFRIDDAAQDITEAIESHVESHPLAYHRDPDQLDFTDEEFEAVKERIRFAIRRALENVELP